MDKGTLYIISAPSGAGKTSLIKQIIADLDQLVVSVSHTTRKMRDSETHGENYFFVALDEFKQMSAEQAFLETAQVFGNYYGTAKQPIATTLNQGIDVILEIDWQGAQQVRKMLPDSLSIFILPPSIEVLQQRLEARGQDNEDVINHRMADATNQMAHFKEFDYLVVNGNFSQALAAIKSIINSQRLTKNRQQEALKPLLNSLTATGVSNM